jgi:hypothetical protein
MQDLRIEGAKLELKIDKKTEVFLEEYKKRKIDFWAKERRGLDVNDVSIRLLVVNTFSQTC